MKNCNLDEIPGFVFSLENLVYLSVESNKINHVTGSLVGLPQITVLSVYGNK